MTEEYNNFIKDIANKLDVDRIVEPLNDDSWKSGEFGPCEFLYLIDNAKYIFTDSFHCVVFSIIFNKEFTAFRRKQPGCEKMFGRIEDLLSSTGKLDCIYGGTTVEATNDFEKLYSNSLKYINDVLESVYNENK